MPVRNAKVQNTLLFHNTGLFTCNLRIKTLKKAALGDLEGHPGLQSEPAKAAEFDIS